MSYHSMKRTLDKLQDRIRIADNPSQLTSHIDLGDDYKYPPGQKVFVIDISEGGGSGIHIADDDGQLVRPT